MAEKLIQYYTYITAEVGLAGRTTLAMKTLMPSTKAAMEPDSTENIEKFRKAVEEITGKPVPDLRLWSPEKREIF